MQILRVIFDPRIGFTGSGRAGRSPALSSGTGETPQQQHAAGQCGDPPYTPVSGVIPLPGQSAPPTDPNRERLYKDLNRNGGIDFNDVVLYFNEMDWISGNKPDLAFDLNKNGRVDFNDIIILFNQL